VSQGAGVAQPQPGSEVRFAASRPVEAAPPRRHDTAFRARAVSLDCSEVVFEPRN